MQQWKCYVVMGNVRDRLVEETLRARDSVGAEGDPTFTTPIPPNPDGSNPRQFPRNYLQKYKDRSRANGRQYYSHIGILGDREQGSVQQRKNYEFFGAPVGIFFYTDLNYLNAWRDCGMFIQTVMLVARAEGLDTIAQGAWRNYEQIVRKYTKADSTETMICGMALGYRDPDEKVMLRHLTSPLSLPPQTKHICAANFF